MYARTVDRQVLTFGHSGCMVDQSFIFFDRQTDSHWVQATGRCIDGRFAGKQLERIPATQTTWAQWRAMHPTTWVLAKPALERYRTNPWYLHESGQTEKKLGLAVFTGSSQKLYPVDILATDVLVRDTIGGRPVLVVYDSASRTAVAYDPMIDGTAAELDIVEGADGKWLVERAGWNVWSALTGRPRFDSTQAGLAQLPSSLFVMAHWPKHFPGSAVYGVP